MMMIKLTELGNAAHTGGQEGLLNSAQFSLAEGMAFPALRGSLLVTMQVQAVWQAQHTWEEKNHKIRLHTAIIWRA